MVKDGFNGDHGNPEFYLHGKLVGTTRKEYDAARRALQERAHEQRFKASIPGARYGYGQAGVVVIRADGEHATVGAVHAALIDGTLHVTVEAEPGMPVQIAPTVRRDRWRFYDFWRYDAKKVDNFIRPESEWPTINVYPREQHEAS